MENRETFFARLEPLFPPGTLLDIKLAYMLAKFGHRAQFRKEIDESGEKVRYFEHLRRVAINVVDVAKCARADMIIVALLHDALEDARDLTPELLEHTFDSDTVAMVKVLSKTPKEGYIERFQLCTDWRPYVVKACDRLDNIRSLEQTTPEFQTKQVKETREKYYPLFRRMVELSPPTHRPWIEELRTTIERETERLAGKLGNV